MDSATLPQFRESEPDMDFKTIQNALDKLVVLDIRTVVGEFQYDADGKLQPADGAKQLISRINLLDGDITTAFSNEFLTEPLSTVREFHSAREKQGQEIIQGNIKALQEMVKLIADLAAREEESRNAPPGNLST